MHDAARGEHIAQGAFLSSVPDWPGAKTLEGLSFSIEQDEVMADRYSETPADEMGDRLVEQSV
jgi:hypothetical protein